jgi:hypothetical protein
MTHVIKRTRDYSEQYDERKLYASVYAICLSMREAAADAELIAGKVVSDIQPWLSDKPEVTSGDLRNQAAKYLRRYNPDAAYLYMHHHKLGR